MNYTVAYIKTQGTTNKECCYQSCLFGFKKAHFTLDLKETARFMIEVEISPEKLQNYTNIEDLKESMQETFYVVARLYTK